MKKLISLLLAIALLFGAGVCANAAATYYKYDVDFDGSVTADDARSVLRRAVDLDLFIGLQDFAADDDCNGEIDASDARATLRAAVRLTPVFALTEGYYSNGAVYASFDEVPQGSKYYVYRTLDCELLYRASPADLPPAAGTGKSNYTEENDPYYHMPFVEDMDNDTIHNPAYAGLYYNSWTEIHCNYDDLAEGEGYFYFDDLGVCRNGRVPYMMTEPPRDDICQFCGKKSCYPGFGKVGCASQYGGCDRYIADVNCPICGQFVSTHTCHTCPQSYRKELRPAVYYGPK